MNKKKNIALGISILLNVAFVMFFVGKRIYYSNHDFFHPPVNNLTRLLSEKPDTADVIFLGTSLTYGFPLQEAFNNPHIKNCGQAGITTSGLITHLQQIVKRHPNKIFLEGGINDLRKNLGSEVAYNNIAKMLDMVKAESPKTTIYMQSIMPTDSSYLNKQILPLNGRIETLAKDKNVIYIDLYSALAKNGELDRAATIDGIHFNSVGYYLWRRAIECYL
ncbi:GDSL-type esterase/lipase family protein [Mucilaginibacter pedocola]|uniref:SGNH hydrolase-type esterase domain-containing protein n=1 Tax=Mucilaginibacter pedocola TaxID=1792845 RepID=A0A1S9PEG0_9SPHI|nr:GDSL-type esterase/lipase family protein [Mucilaginibacter pedocola]OOQ59336.1 hypothetical protein BC343_27965 [Mucilaginibacter pedocola]